MLHTVQTETRRGFTLIELLVVIAIIAILAAILFPVFAKAREKARQTACLSNEKQITLGMMQYVQDFDETMPAETTTASVYHTDIPHYSWSFVIYPYVKSKEVWICPDDKTDPLNSYPGGRYVNNFDSSDDIVRTYAVVTQYHGNKTPGPAGNTAMMLMGHDYDHDPDITLASIPEPANTIWLMESGENVKYGFPGADGTCWDTPCDDVVVAEGEGGGDYDVQQRLTWNKGASHANYIAQYHSDGANYGYGDGHVKYAHIEQLMSSTDGSKDAFVRLKQ